MQSFGVDTQLPRRLRATQQKLAKYGYLDGGDL
jgi:hypothetical protein